ncbi:type II/IV secretion system ATPase subunit [Haloferacaceae archaeon DSL9]
MKRGWGCSDERREPSESTSTVARDAPLAVVGTYAWEDYAAEFGPAGASDALRAASVADAESDRREEPRPPRIDWSRAPFDPSPALGFHPTATRDVVVGAGRRALRVDDWFEAFCDPATTPVVKDSYLWEHYKREYHYEADGSRPRDADGEIVPFDPSPALGFAPDETESRLAAGARAADALADLVAERTVNVDEDLDEEAFFCDADGRSTIVTRYDLEKAVPVAKKAHFHEVERYWVNEPFAFVSIFHSSKENEKKYYVVEPYQNPIEADVTSFLIGKLRTSIKYADHGSTATDESSRRTVIETETDRLLDRYGLHANATRQPLGNALAALPELAVSGANTLIERINALCLKRGLGGRVGPLRRLDPDRAAIDVDPADPLGKRLLALGYEEPPADGAALPGSAARPEPAVLAENAETLTPYQIEKLRYVLARDFLGYELIDPVKHDINVEDISCDGYNSPVFVYHSEYEQLISNLVHGERSLDEFVVKLAQRSGKGISKRHPQVDATLPDGSRAQLTLGREVSDHGTNYTIRQFKDVPFTPIDLINWRTFSLEEMAYLWLCIENHKSLIFAGGTASGKTTSLNAVSLFIPSSAKLVSIEDTREVELPQRNWIASVTRPSFSDDDKGDVDEFDLLEAALRQRPDYIVMGEIRGEEGRTLFQVMSTGHTTYTTFHADTVGEVLKRFTTQPINVSKTMFTALDLVSIQASTRVQGRKVRRNKSLTEINHYDAEKDEINVQDVFQWQAETDEFLRMGESNTLSEIMFDRGWSESRLREALFARRAVLAYLIDRGLNTYTQVAATIQAFIADPETVLGLMATDRLEASLEDLREMESVFIDIDPETEALVPRPDPDAAQREEAAAIVARAERELFASHRTTGDDSVDDVLDELASARHHQTGTAANRSAGGAPTRASEVSKPTEAVASGAESAHVDATETAADRDEGSVGRPDDDGRCPP